MYCFHCSRLRGVVASDAGSEVRVGGCGIFFPPPIVIAKLRPLLFPRPRASSPRVSSKITNNFGDGPRSDYHQPKRQAIEPAGFYLPFSFLPSLRILNAKYSPAENI